MPRHMIPATCLASIVLGQAAHGVPAEGLDFSKVTMMVRERVDSGAVPSISVAVARHGRIVWEYSYGFANLDKKVLATPATPYYLASVSKAITATALMQLVGAQILDLDHPANEYLGDAKLSSPKWDVRGATVRRLANHMAGLPTYDQSCYLDEPQCAASGDQLIRRFGVVTWPPGDHFDYSNAGYGILGEIVARASREPLADYLQQRVFRPAAMSSCFLRISTSPMGTAALRYQAGPARVGSSTPPSLSTTPSASSVYCSAHDLASFGMLHLKDHAAGGHAALGDDSIDVMRRSPVPVQAGLDYGLGWWMQDNLHGFRGVQAQGGTSDATAYLQLIPSEDIAVAVLSNTGTGAGQKVVDEVLATLLPKYAENLQGDRAKTAAPAKPVPEAQRPVPGRWSGFVLTYSGQTALDVSVDGAGNVIAKLGTQPEVAAVKTRYRNGVLNFQIPGTLPIEDPWVAPFALRFELHEREGSFTGAVTTASEPEARHGALLSFWVEL